jgi:hypothetical protein
LRDGSLRDGRRVSDGDPAVSLAKGPKGAKICTARPRQLAEEDEAGREEEQRNVGKFGIWGTAWAFA